MPTKFYIPEDATRSGIEIRWCKTGQYLCIGGWYDSCVGLDGKTITLAGFFGKLGITENDCKKAFKELKNTERT